MKNVRFLMVLALSTVALTACAGTANEKAQDGPATADTGALGHVIAKTSKAQPKTTAADKALTTETEPTKSSEFDAADPLAGLVGEGTNGTPDVKAIKENIPADGTQSWGQDGCLWVVVQGYWLQSGVCGVPDANGNRSIYYLYPFGTDPGQSWFAEVSIDPALTVNGSYFVYFPKGSSSWVRCHTDCSNIANFEIYAGQGWWTYGQITSSYQQSVQEAQDQTTTVVVGGNTPALSRSNSALAATQGAPAESGISAPEWQFVNMIQDQLSRSALNSFNAPCTNTYRGCA